MLLDFRQQALTPATVPGQGQLRWPRGAQSAPLNTEKIQQNRASLVLLDFFCVLVVRELAWRLKPSWRKRVCSSIQVSSPVGSPEGRRSFGAGLGARSAQRYPRQIPICLLTIETQQKAAVPKGPAGFCLRARQVRRAVYFSIRWISKGALVMKRKVQSSRAVAP